MPLESTRKRSRIATDVDDIGRATLRYGHNSGVSTIGWRVFHDHQARKRLCNAPRGADCSRSRLTLESLETLTRPEGQMIDKGKDAVTCLNQTDYVVRAVEYSADLRRVFSLDTRSTEQALSIIEELLRWDALTELRAYMGKVAHQHRFRVPEHALLRWCFGQKVDEQLRGERVIDPVLPQQSDKVDAMLVEELYDSLVAARPDSDLEAARKLAGDVASKLTIEANQIVEVLYATARSQLNSTPVLKIQAAVVGHEVDLSCAGVVHTIKLSHFLKLQQLFVRHTLERATDATASLALKDEGELDRFLTCSFRLLQRYRTMFGFHPADGSGLQGALPPAVFAKLRELFDVSFECFASPLNCFFENYCSAFIDTDTYFGSCGSFFQFRPVEGSFEANPPFQCDLMEKAATRMIDMLKSSEKPLSFVYIIPEWQTPPFALLAELQKSEFNRMDFVLSSGTHYYIDGGQHVMKCQVFKPPCGTHVYFLQNQRGFAKWPPTTEKIAQVRSAFVPPSKP